jgi:GT2 family glycosyltransferase
MIYAAIVTYNRRPALQRLMDNPDFWNGLAKAGTARVVVLDQGSTDRTGSYLLGKNCQWIHGIYNYGCGGGRQRIVDWLTGNGMTYGDIVIFLDDDIQVAGKRWAEQLIDPIRNYRACISGAFGRRVTDDWLTEEACDHPDYVSGCAMAADGRVFMDAAFDPQFFPNYWEDADLCWQARSLGYFVQAVQAEICHDSAMDVAAAAPLMAANREKFRAKWEGKRPR